jgi:YegS/Rv2252/BmrU family lipid kinase
MQAAVIVNPVSGTGARPGEGRRRIELASARLRARGLTADVRATEGSGHARTLAQEARDAGARVVVAWGGDGTVNEVASALVGGVTALGIVPSGSGNGLASELRLPRDPAAALDVALDGAERVIDVGELDGRVFVNVAGVGVDARIAHRFAQWGAQRRGLRRYVECTFRELATFRADEIVMSVDGVVSSVKPLILALANARQYGNGALIAPQAKLDDGRLDLVVVGERSWLATARDVPKLFTGRIATARGVLMSSITELVLSSSAPLVYHVDGEPCVGGTELRARVVPAALRVRTAG